MMRLSLLSKIVFGLVCILVGMSAQAQRKVGYMPYWSGSADAIQYSKLTHINYSFAIPQSNGSIYAVENGAKLNSIVSQAHAKGVKVLIAIGGWSYNGAELNPVFESLAANASYRAKFVSDAMYIVNQYNLDGVDIDWEYPRSYSAGNFNALLSELSAKLRPAGKLLSAAVIGNDQWNNGITAGSIAPLDFLNIMAYDAGGADHSTMAFAQSCVNSYLAKGFPASKINLGVPFYAQPSGTSWANLLAQGANVNADNFNGQGYNGIPTIKAKANYVKSNGLGGIMIWELSQDVNDNRSLLSAIHEVINGTTQPPVETQSPYAGVIAIPGKLQAENYDKGGQGVSFSDNTPGNSGNNYRSDDVDVEAATEEGSNIGYIVAGEWLEYSVNVQTAGTYTVSARVASTVANTSFKIEIPGSSAITVNVPNTGGWQNWQTVTINNVSLTAGQKILKLNFTSGDFNVNFINFALNTQPPATGPVIVYQNCNGDAGYSVGLEAGNYTLAQLRAKGINDNDISRITVQSGYTVVAYADDNFSGNSVTLTSDAACLTNNGFNDVITSIKITQGTVNPGNKAPTISLTAPSNGATFTAPANVTISANASDSDGSISKVEFYYNSTLIGTDNSSPYSVTWSNVGAGTYSITAKATDNLGATATTGAVSITVNGTTTGGCSGVAQYVENGGYKEGSKVKNAGNQYVCKPWPFSGWCNGAAWAYGPGTGAYWTDAWTLAGSCGSGRGTEDNATAAVDAAKVSNAPNPFSTSTTIEVATSEAGDVTVQLYNKAGQLVKTISDSYMNAGTHQFFLDASSLQADLYLIKCNTPNGVITRKIIKTE